MILQSQKFNSAHQVIGLIAFGLILFQFAIGLIHHLRYKRTQQATKMKPVHIWLGRIVIPLGVVNAFV